GAARSSGPSPWPARAARRSGGGGAATSAVASARGCCDSPARPARLGGPPRLAALRARVVIGQVDLVRPDRLDLRAGQHDPGLERLVDRELVAGLSIYGDGDVVCHGGGSGASRRWSRV